MEQWTRHNLWIWKDDKPVAKGIAEKITDLEQARIYIEFIVRACNAHKALIEACKMALLFGLQENVSKKMRAAIKLAEEE